MQSTLLFVSLIFCALLLATTATPCDENNPDELCLSPLVRKRGGSGSGTGSVSSKRRGSGSSGGGSRRPGGRRPIIVGGGGSRRPNNDNDNDNNDVPSETDDLGQAVQEEDACFPGNAKVHVEGKGIVNMEQVAIGDRVLVSDGVFSEVFFFGHKLARIQFDFVRLETAQASIALSKGHYIYADGHLTAAGSVRVDSMLETADGVHTAVIAVEVITAAGLYNPHTLHGDITVDGFRASTYTTSMDLTVAKSLLAPVRAAFRLIGVDICGQYFDNGTPATLRRRIPRGASIVTT